MLKTLSNAWHLRHILNLAASSDTTAYRLFNAEGDGIPGLVIDLYNDTVVMQCHSAGVRRWNLLLKDALCHLLKQRVNAVLERSPGGEDRNTKKEQIQYLFGHPGEILIRENSLTFLVDCEDGQKTGFFLDQRENRRLLRYYAAKRKVLNTFSYTGGFSVYALSGGAAEVCSVDISSSSLALLHENVARNFPAASSSAACADCMEYLQNLDSVYDLIILDPPAFVKHRGALKGGLKGYETINYHALRQIAPGGLLFSFSCSAHVDRLLFSEILTRAATRAARHVRVLHQLSQAPCHPVSLYHPEGAYLKGLVLYVE